ncbi:HNH endonuclease [Vibrio diabolicus]|uniref:HNH endonuclease n=1 Tax=Vibrio diabolicus TaxID=50719 RepID=UPI00215FD283|nr:HNH endonuclease [Vibrio diabolicus]
MKKCIICRTEQTEFSDEHVIPDSLGGYYHIYSVCGTCNSFLGSNVDSCLVNHKFSDFQRFLLGIKGKSGKLPNPFSGTHSLKGDSTQKVQIRIDDDSKTVPYFLPQVEHTKNNGIVESIRIAVDAKDESNIERIVSKTSKRLNIPRELISDGEKVVHSNSKPEIHMSLSIDLHEFKLGLLKIAYEFAVDSIPEYFDDSSAIEISKILHSACHERTTEFVNFGNGLQHEILEPFEGLLDLDSKKHYLILTPCFKGLYCFIKLHQLFTVGVLLSERVYLEDTFVVGINDIDAKNFRKITAFELLDETHSRPGLRFAYWFKDQNEAAQFQIMQSHPNFDFYRVGDDIPMYKLGETQPHATVYEKMKALEQEAQAVGSEGMVTKVELDEELYIKVMPFNIGIRVVAIQEEREQVRKL